MQLYRETPLQVCFGIGTLWGKKNYMYVFFVLRKTVRRSSDIRFLALFLSGDINVGVVFVPPRA